MPKPIKHTRGGSRKGKVKPGRRGNGLRHTMTRLSVRKDAKRD
jgi:hypothetical protein